LLETGEQLLFRLAHLRGSSGIAVGSGQLFELFDRQIAGQASAQSG
jgi:hypothetical protein